MLENPLLSIASIEAEGAGPAPPNAASKAESQGSFGESKTVELELESLSHI
jgi:hypothetical protein